MKAIVFHKAKKVLIEEVKDPILQKDEDAIVKITSTSICGTDLHIYNGLMTQKYPMIMGHEFMGIVQEVGKDVVSAKVGDRVIVPCIISCGTCYFCQNELTAHCEKSNPVHYGPEGLPPDQVGGGVYGYTDTYGGYDGGQAEYVKVSFANANLKVVNHQLPDEQVLFLTDIFPTGWTAIERAHLKGGETVVIFGCGPVGIMCQKAAWLLGAGKVIAIDPLEYRLSIAEKAGNAETIKFESSEQVVDTIRARTDGRGADVCVDAVGMEAKRSIWEKLNNVIRYEAGTINVLKLCVSACRRGGIVSIIGVYGSDYSRFPLGQIFDKGLEIHTGAVLLHKYYDKLAKLVEDKKVILNDIITHTLPLEQGPFAYDIFCNKKDNCLKVILKP